MKRRNAKVSKAIYPLILALVAAIGMLVGYRMHEGGNHAPLMFTKNTEKGNLGRVEEVLRLIEAKYVDDVDSDHLVNVAVQAIVNELDPHSIYLDKADVESIKNQMNGSYKGLGIESIELNDTLSILRVLDESPAQKAGIQYGDQIIAINDSTIIGSASLDKLKAFLAKDSITQYQLKIVDIHGKNKSITIEPGKVPVPNVHSFAINDSVGYIKINRFINRTYDDVVKSLEVFQNNNIIEQLIIDVRDNPGGYLPEVIKILNQLFIEDKRLLLYTQGQNSRKNEYKTTGRPFYQINKLAILINENSASASEILAGALQDWDKAVIIGESSFGKGLVQEQFKINTGGALRLTTARYYTPTGRFIQLPYNQDTLQIDSTKFYSKSLQRLLNRDGGITPDISLKKSNIDKRIETYLETDLPIAAFNFIRKNKLFQKKDVRLDEYNTLIHEAAVKYQMEFSERFQSTKQPSVKSIKNYLKYQVAKQLNLKVQEQKALVELDDILQLAKNKLSQQKIETLLKSTSNE